MTSTLTLHSAQARGEEPDAARQFWRDPFDKGKLIASDSEDGKTKRPKTKKGRFVARDRFDELLAPFSERLQDVREKAMAPLKMMGQRMDFILDGASQAGMLWEQLMQQANAWLFAPPKVAMPLAEGEAPPLPERQVSFCDLFAFNVQFTDNQDVPLYNFEGQKKSRYAASPLVVDPIANEKAMIAIRECAERANGIPPATEGRYAGLPLGLVLMNATEEDLQGFLGYVRAYPGNYVGRNLKVSETFATWIVYGAPEV
ncbi:MAG: hypothetical protein H7338_21915 [Candidatus Sericytochromatia bacterium]|nr:hypothetical protein [Candidatus Sericytochromatia bacterium]